MHVLTCLLTACPDPQRDRRWEASLDAYRPLADSLDAHGLRLTVLADCPVEAEEPIDVIPVRAGGNPYFHRWAVLAEHAARLDGWVWCVDGTDVELLELPDPDAECLHIGSEPEVVGSSWMRATSPAHRGWIADHADEVLLNPGVVGGPADVVARFGRLVAGRECADMTDMAVANLVARGLGFVTGPPVHTPYKTHSRTAGCWWRHK